LPFGGRAALRLAAEGQSTPGISNGLAITSRFGRTADVLIEERLAADRSSRLADEQRCDNRAQASNIRVVLIDRSREGPFEIDVSDAAVHPCRPKDLMVADVDSYP
jgi:hypothetical protein